MYIFGKQQTIFHCVYFPIAGLLQAEGGEPETERGEYPDCCGEGPLESCFADARSYVYDEHRSVSRAAGVIARRPRSPSVRPPTTPTLSSHRAPIHRLLQHGSVLGRDRGVRFRGISVQSLAELENWLMYAFIL